MKKFRFFSVAVAVVMAMSVSVWAACTVTHPLGTLNGYATGQTSLACRTLTCSGSFLKTVNINGKLSSACTPANGWIRLYQLNGAQQILIDSVSVPLNTNFNVTITPRPNTYSCNNVTYCIAGYVKTSSTGLCGITLTGSATFNCDP